jgi:CubicO group peptidase (beta-lactamase class C family)
MPSGAPKYLPVVDREHEQVRVAVPDGVTRTAVYLGDQGCVSLPVGKDSKVKEAVDAAFARPDAKRAAFVVTWRGRLIAEPYAPGITTQTPLESWSMGKSVTATLMGVLIQQGARSQSSP